jgi:hypothetical protein
LPRCSPICTIKGNARTFELTSITVPHAARLSTTGYEKSRHLESVTLTELTAVEQAIERYVDVSENKLGRKGRASNAFRRAGGICFLMK